MWPAVVALVPIVMAAAYMLRVLQGMMNGPELADLPQRRDMTPLEMLALAPLVIAIVFLGVDPGAGRSRRLATMSPPAPLGHPSPR